MDLSEIDRIYALYDKRYNLDKMAVINGLPEKQYSLLSSRDKFIMLSKKLREVSKVNLASFFFGKLFEVSNDLEALINKIECLIELGEYDEAIKYNNLACELYMEDDAVDAAEIECKIRQEQCTLLFYTGKNETARWYCEEAIIDNGKKELFYLLFAIMIATSDFDGAGRLFRKYGNISGDKIDFITESLIHLLNANKFKEGMNYIRTIYNFTPMQQEAITKHINGYSPVNKNRTIIKDFFVKEISFR
ncbi:MAG: hypothetical protein IKQ61_07720 [Spirochaetales bacterium]|jgi:tetratricopeptide (TPR) repeat protein|nr:hypothetical protein [Spirochaetales bacterium]MBR6062263.1 hypothetical protein [Spirochaetales bacterium]MBR6200131.1 hypothetical protein [Spirochaetales bacterium]